MADGANNKGAKKKEKLVFAKDKNQAIVAMVVVTFFALHSLYMVVKYFIDQGSQAKVQVSTVMDGTQLQNETANKMAEQQKENLESLASGGLNTSVEQNIAQDANDIYSQTMNLKGDRNPSTSGGNRVVRDADNEVDIIAKKTSTKKRGKMVMISVADSGRSNPFLPADENIVPSSSLNYLTAPPETLQTDSEASKVMTTTISGILYDKYSPSAIINIEGSDYLVKRGDIINHYKILAISKNQVIVQLGKNIYQAGVGQLLTKTDLNYNTIANLNKKFGGNSVSINVRKKGY